MDELVEFCRSLQDGLAPEDRFEDLLLDATNARNPIHLASVLKKKLLDLKDRASYPTDSAFRQWMNDRFSSAQPNEYHKTIVATRFPAVLTTNYDRLLTQAARTVVPSLALRTYSFKNSDQLAAAIYDGRPFIVHVHGSTVDIGV